MYTSLLASGAAAVAHLFRNSTVSNSTGDQVPNDLHAARHIVARRGQQIRAVGTPLHLAHGPLVPDELRLAHAADARRVRGAELDHAAVPHARELVDAAAGERERAVLVPVEREHLGPRRGHCERRGCERLCEAVRAGPLGVRRRAQVEELERAVGGAGCDEVGLVRRKEGLVDAG